MTTIRLRRDPAATWASANPILASGEPGVETDTGKVKFGDGSSHWNALPYGVDIRLTGAATLDFPSVAAQSFQDLTITVTGATTGDAVALGVPTAAITAGITFSAWVSATSTVTIRAHNYTAGALEPASGAFKATVVR